MIFSLENTQHLSIWEILLWWTSFYKTFLELLIKKMQVKEINVVKVLEVLSSVVFQKSLCRLYCRWCPRSLCPSSFTSIGWNHASALRILELSHLCGLSHLSSNHDFLSDWSSFILFRPLWDVVDTLCPWFKKKKEKKPISLINLPSALRTPCPPFHGLAHSIYSVFIDSVELSFIRLVLFMKPHHSVSS